MRRLLTLTTLLLIAGVGIACRELASPMAKLEERRTVTGTLHRADGVPVWGARIEFQPYSSVFTGQFAAITFVDEEGRFSLDVPDIPLRATIIPPVGSGVPPRILEPVDFFEDRELSMVLPGFAVHGILVDRSEGLNARTQVLYFRSVLDEPVLGISQVQDFAQVDMEGRFEAYCHTAGFYEVDFHQNLGVRDESYMRIAASLPIEQGDSLVLTLPLMSVDVEWLLDGDPAEVLIPSRVISYVVDEGVFRPSSAHRISESLSPTRHRLYVLQDANYLYPYGVSGHPGLIPQVSPFGPAQPGQSLRHELGEFLLQLRAEDARGGDTTGAVRVTLRTAEIAFLPGTVQRLYILNPGESLRFNMNAGSYRIELRSQEGLYQTHLQVFTMTGDLEWTIPLTPTP